MPDAIVMNTLTGAVSEYDNFGFQSIAGDLAGNATGLYRLGGDTDLGEPIVASIVTGKTLWDASLKKFVDMIYASVKGSGVSTASVIGENDTYTYEITIRETGESRVKPGRGIRENYLAFGYSNTDGADFTLDRLEVLASNTKTRRV